VQDVDMSDENDNKSKSSKEIKRSGLCEPEDIISEVVVDYQGDYVLSQLLQWYNAGIDQKTGLPDILGCALLPSMSGCWTIDTTKVSNAATGTRTKYQSNVRPKLVEWFKDPFKRGNPWADDLRRVFVDKDDDYIEKESTIWLPIGSPVLDFLVTGDDCNLMDVLRELGTDPSSFENNSADGLLSSVDHGRPAQAVTEWVQCENPDCKKWRKIPWHVDIDMVSQKFVCSDHIWGLNPPSCDTPEDVWDEATDACVEADGSVKPKDAENSLAPTKDSYNGHFSNTSYNITEYKIGTRFDVLRPGKEKWSIANVVDVALDSKKIKFHFVKTQSKNDVWLEEHSDRITPLHTHTSESKQRSPAKLQPPSIADSNDSQGKSKKASKLDKLKKKFKANQRREKTASCISQSSEASKKYDKFETSSNETEIKKTRADDDDEDDEGLNDEISSEDDDSDGDEENEYDIQMEEETGNSDIASGDDSEEEEVQKKSTMINRRSSDRLSKRKTEGIRSEHSDIENECTKVTDQTNSVFTIPKKKESTKKSFIVRPKDAIPKKPQASSSGGTSLISNALKLAMLEERSEKKCTSRAKKILSLTRSPAKDKSKGRKNEMHFTDANIPSVKKTTFSDLCHSPSQHIRSPSSTEAPRDEPEIHNGNNPRSSLSRAMVAPKRPYKDKYSIEQRRERELYRDSNEYTARREDYSPHDSSDMHDHSNRMANDYNDVAQRSPSFDRRRIHQFDQTLSPRSLNTRTYVSHSQHDQYEDRSRYDDRSHYQNEDDSYRTRRYDGSHNEENDEWSRERSSDLQSRNIPNHRGEDYQQYNDELTNGRRMNTDDRYRNDYSRRNQIDPNLYESRRSEVYHDRREREFNDRDNYRDGYHRVDDEYEHRFTSQSDTNDYYRVDDRHSKRRRHDSASRRDERRRRTFDGSDEYSRRLESYNNSNERNYQNEDRRRGDRYNR